MLADKKKTREGRIKKVPIDILFLTVMLLFSVRLSHAREQDQAGLPFSAAVKFGNLLFLSGLLGTDLKTGKFVSPEVGQQTTQCLEILGLILRHAKMDYGDVVSRTVYLTDLVDYGEMNKAYCPYFPKDPPARTCVKVPVTDFLPIFWATILTKREPGPP